MFEIYIYQPSRSSATNAAAAEKPPIRVSRFPMPNQFNGALQPQPHLGTPKTRLDARVDQST